MKNHHASSTDPPSQPSEPNSAHGSLRHKKPRSGAKEESGHGPPKHAAELALTVAYLALKLAEAAVALIRGLL